jgi:hypothetical protein
MKKILHVWICKIILRSNISEYKRRKIDLLLVLEPSHLVNLKIKGRKHKQVKIASLWRDSNVPFLIALLNTDTIFWLLCVSGRAIS